VFDVSRKRDTYGPGGSYALFAGKDGSRALGLSSLKPEDAVPDWSTLEEKDRKTLDDWHAFFTCVFLSPAFLVPSGWPLTYASRPLFRTVTGNGTISSAASLTCQKRLRTSDALIGLVA